MKKYTMACSGLTELEINLVTEALENLKAEYEQKESAPGTKMNEQAMFQQAQDEVETILMKIAGSNASGGRRRRGRKTRKARKARKGSRKARKGSRKGRKGSRKGRKGSRKGRKGTRRA